MPSKFFTKPYFRINPAGKPEMPSWKIFISLLENYFFSVGKSNFSSRAILDDFFGSLLNYFKLFLFILKPYAVRQLKVKMFDSARWAMSDESWVMSFFDKRTKGHVFSFESYVLMSNLIAHVSLLTTQKSVVSACHCPHLSKNKKREFWTEWRKYKNYQPSYSQANTKPWKTFRKHTKKRFKCFLSFT